MVMKIPPDPPLGEGDKKTCLSDVTLIMKQTISYLYRTPPGLSNRPARELRSL